MGYSNITGIDISPSQVEIGNQVVPNVVKGNVLNFLEGHKGKFDLITGRDIIDKFYKDEVFQFLDACYQALKPVGRAIFQTPNMDSPGELYIDIMTLPVSWI